jgi:hypothetical protein
LFIYIGYRISDPVSRRAFSTLRGGLDATGTASAHLGVIARHQALQAGRQATSARYLAEELRTLSELADGLHHGAATLQEATGGMWADLSYPGAQPGPETTLRLARQMAVAAGQLGGSAERARELCQHLRTTLNRLIAEASVLQDSGTEVTAATEELRAALARVEEALSGQADSGADAGTATAAEPSEARGVSGWIGGVVARASAATEMLVARLDAWLARRQEEDAAAPEEPPRRSGTSPAQGPQRPGARPARDPRASGHQDAVGRDPRWEPLRRASQPPERHRPGMAGGEWHPAATSGPRAPGNHPPVRGQFHAPWYSDGEDLSGAPGYGDDDGAGYRPEEGPRPPRGQWHRPRPGLDPGPEQGK